MRPRPPALTRDVAFAAGAQLRFWGRGHLLPGGVRWAIEYTSTVSEFNPFLSEEMISNPAKVAARFEALFVKAWQASVGKPTAFRDAVHARMTKSNEGLYVDRRPVLSELWKAATDCLQNEETT